MALTLGSIMNVGESGILEDLRPVTEERPHGDGNGGWFRRVGGEREGRVVAVAKAAEEEEGEDEKRECD